VRTVTGMGACGRVLGVGIDLCELDRIERLLTRLGDQFLRRAYNPREIEYIRDGRDAGRRCAGLFAAKEAVVKCLGTGFASGVGWKQVEVTPRHWRRPSAGWEVVLHGEACRRSEAWGPTTWSLDIRFTRLYAAAVAIWTADELPDAVMASGQAEPDLPIRMETQGYAG
jgi:holo-[acyl-carrier protein] synthase